jgi:predicted nucleic acid-binding protein
MIFADLPASESVFLEANTLVYHFEPHPQFGPPCTELLERIENQELTGYTSTHVLAETTHRLMTFEACAAFGWPFAGIAQRLKRDPACIQSLTRFRQALQEVTRYRVQVLALSATLGDVGAAISQGFGLLTNDALLAAIMQQHGLANLASNDADFDRVPWIARFAPA